MPTAEEVRAQIEETRERLGRQVDGLATRTHHELDWRARLKRNLPKVAIGVAALGVVVGLGVLLKSRIGPSDEEKLRRALTNPRDLRELAVQVRMLREEIDTRMTRDDSFAKRTAARYVTTAGVATGTLVTQKLLARFAPDMAGEIETKDAQQVAHNVAALSWVAGGKRRRCCRPGS